MLNFIKDEVKPDVLFFTGDMTPHNVWDNSEEEILFYLNELSQEMIDLFGKDFPVFPL